MLRKKNYKSEEHFSQYYSFSLPLESGKKIIIYYRRYRPAATSNEKVAEIYDLIHSNNQSLQESKAKKQTLYPIDRTLQLVTFDEQLQNKIEPVMKKVGKVRKFQFGQGFFRNREIYFCLAVFKYEFDLVKCFREEFIQTIIQQQLKIYQNQQDKEDYKSKLIQKYLKNELESKNKKMKQLHDQGYNLITSRNGLFQINRQRNQKWIQNLPQLKKRKKALQTASDLLKTKLQ